jgi:type IV secretion system protein VirD4
LFCRHRHLKGPVRCAADSIRQHGTPAFPVAAFENVYSLIGSDSFADWSLYAWRPNLWGQIAVVFTIVLVMTWAATQWTAFRLGFQPQLGNPWFELAGWPVYYPPAFFWWWFSFDAYAPAIFTEGGVIATSGGFLAIAAAILMSIIRAREARNVATYGSARWAEDKEIRAAGLLGPDGVVLGRHARTICAMTAPSMSFASRRRAAAKASARRADAADLAGKLHRPRHQGENWTLTAGFRAQHGRVLLFDPTNAHRQPTTRCWRSGRGNGKSATSRTSRIFWSIPKAVSTSATIGKRPAIRLLVGAILHVLYAEKDKTLAGVASFLSDPRRPVEATLRAMMDTPHLGEAGVHPVIASSARELLNKSENERSGVLSTAMSFLGLYRDPVVARVTARCDWRIADLVGSKSRSASTSSYRHPTSTAPSR